MTTTKAIIISVISAIVITAIGLVAFVGLQSSGSGLSLGAQVQNDIFNFTQGITNGRFNQVSYTNLGAQTAPEGGTTEAPLSISTSTALAANYSCATPVIILATSTASVTVTLPTAAALNAPYTGCLNQDGEYSWGKISIASGNSFNIVLATSTGDSLFYNGTSTAGGATLATSSAGTLYSLDVYRINSSTDYFVVGNNGSAH